MGKKSISLRAELSVGSSVGWDLYHRIKAAKESVFVISPYLNQHLLDCLLELHERGVVVDLVTMEDSIRKPHAATDRDRKKTRFTTTPPR